MQVYLVPKLNLISYYFLLKSFLVFSINKIIFFFSRIISNISNVPLSNILRKNLKQEELENLDNSQEILKDLNLVIYDTPNLSISELKSIARMQYMEEKILFLMV